MPGAGDSSNKCRLDEAAGQTFRELRYRTEVSQVAGSLASQDGVERVMKIVVPLRVQPIPPASRGVTICGWLRSLSAITPDGDRPRLQLMDLCAELLEKRNRRGVEDCVDRVEAQASRR